jgi:hypothetical protein
MRVHLVSGKSAFVCVEVIVNPVLKYTMMRSPLVRWAHRQKEL